MRLRLLAAATIGAVIAFFVAFPVDMRPTCGSFPHADTCFGGPIPAGWFAQAGVVAFVVFVAVLVAGWLVTRR
jgi:hypothetical protein